MIPERLVEEAEDLRREGFTIDLTEADGLIYVVFKVYAVPAGYSKERTSLLLKAPLSYPNGNLDMFWTDADLVLADGKVPKSAEAIDELQGNRWRKFSWHPQGWNPGTDGLRRYLEFVNARLTKRVSA